MYNIKEVETIGSKKTGISSMQIKDILKLLIDDNLVNCEKCGISNIYWSFKYTSVKKLNQDFIKLSGTKNELVTSINDCDSEIEELKLNRQKSSQRDLKLSKVNQLRELNLKLLDEIESIELNNPESLSKREDNLNLINEYIEIMMDNLNILVTFIADSTSSGMSKADIREYFNIPEE